MSGDAGLLGLTAYEIDQVGFVSGAGWNETVAPIEPKPTGTSAATTRAPRTSTSPVTSTPSAAVRPWVVGSKEQLQLATVDTARAIFVDVVVTPGLRASGAERVRPWCDAFLDHVQERVFPGGCFFVAAASEMGIRSGSVHDHVAEYQDQWMGLLEAAVREGQARGELSSDVGPVQTAFELNALLVAANIGFNLHADAAVIRRTRSSMHRLLAELSSA